jgi:hypothetical protein
MEAAARAVSCRAIIKKVTKYGDKQRISCDNIFKVKTRLVNEKDVPTG